MTIQKRYTLVKVQIWHCTKSTISIQQAMYMEVLHFCTSSEQKVHPPNAWIAYVLFRTSTDTNKTKEKKDTPLRKAPLHSEVSGSWHYISKRSASTPPVAIFSFTKKPLQVSLHPRDTTKKAKEGKREAR